MKYISTVNDYLNDLIVYEQNENSFKVKETTTFCNHLQDVENELEKSFIEFSEEEILDIIAGAKNQSTSWRIATNKTQLQNYVRWLYKHKYITYEQFATHIAFDKRIITEFVAENKYLRKKIENRFFYSSLELVDFVEQIYNEKTCRGDISRFHTNIAIIYLLWQGFELEDLLTLEKTDLDIDNHSIRGIKIYSEPIFEFLVKYNQTTTYEALKGVSVVFSTERYAFNDMFIKTKKTEPSINALRTLLDETRRKLAKEVKEKHIIFDGDFGAQRIITSGMFERLFFLESEYCEQIAEKDIVSVFKLFGKKVSHRKAYYMLNDYQIWKKIKNTRP